MRERIPNIITMINLFCGCAAIVFLINEEWKTAFVLVGVSLIADFLDGFTARHLGVDSPVGKELDSLADMVSFGVVPGMIMFLILIKNFELTEPDRFWAVLPALPAFLLTMFSALRLARFNLDFEQTDHFIGLNTPASTVFVAGIAIIVNKGVDPLDKYLSNPYVIYIIIAVLCYLLLANLPMFSLKFKNFSWVGNEIRYIFLVLAVILIIITKGTAPTWIIFIYLLLNGFQKFIKTRSEIKERRE